MLLLVDISVILILLFNLLLSLQLY